MTSDAAAPPTATPIIDPMPGKMAEPIMKPHTPPIDVPTILLTFAIAPITYRFLNSSLVMLPRVSSR